MRNLVDFLKFYLKRAKEGYSWKCFAFFITMHRYILKDILFSKALKLFWAFRNCLSNSGSNKSSLLHNSSFWDCFLPHGSTFLSFLQFLDDKWGWALLQYVYWPFGSCDMSGSCVLHIFLLADFSFSYLFIAVPGYHSYVRDVYFKCIALSSYRLSLWHQYS